jgi:vitamin K-dependent gamma-carboxylase
MTPVDAAVLAGFRVLFGMIMVWEVYRYHTYDRIHHYYIEPEFFFPYELFWFVSPLSPSLLYLVFFLMGLSALGIALGLFYRVSAILFLTTYTYVFLLDKTQYNNHYYLIILLALLLVMVDAHRWISLDQKFRPGLRAELIPFWQLFIFRAQIVVVYFYAALAKINPDWLRGEPVRTWLRDRADYPIVGPLFTTEVTVWVFAYGGLLFDLLIGFGLLWRRTRLVSVFLIIFFHLTNSWIFSIGIFPYLMMATTLLFADTDWLRKVFRAVPVRTYTAESPPQKFGYHWVSLLFLALYLGFQLLFPFRHFLYPGNVSWNEQGHRFAWHMKLRDKEGYIAFFIIDPATNRQWTVKPHNDLTPAQVQKMIGRPDMILQYTHHLAAQARQRGIDRPIVKVDSGVSLNGRPFQPLVGSDINLAAVPVNIIAPARWVVPLPPDLPVGQVNP